MKKKSPKQLDREVAKILSPSDLFADPEARRTFAREMRHELQTKQASAKTALNRTEFPFTVKARGEGIIGNYRTEAEACAKAKKLNGWVETRDGEILHDFDE